MTDNSISQFGFEPEISPIVMVDKTISRFPIDTGIYQPVVADSAFSGSPVFGFTGADSPDDLSSTASQVFDGKTIGKLALILAVVVFLIFALGKGMGK
jgi:hypothetical protein